MFKQLLRALKKQAQPASIEPLLAAARAAFDLETRAGDAECERLLLRALQLEPDNGLAHFALSLLLTADGAFARAEPHLRAAYARSPGDGYTLYTLLMVLLQRDNWPEGYTLFSRWRNTIANCHAAPHITALPAWRGESLEGRRLVLWTDWGGYGDDIAFLRFARHIRETLRPARVIVAARAPLLRLLAAQPYVDEAVALDAPIEADLQCALIEAPHALRTPLAALPAWPAYIEPVPAPKAAWARRLREETRLKVGLTWTSTSVHAHDADHIGRFDKHLRNRELAAFADLPGIAFVSLQLGAGIPPAAELLPGATVIDPGSEIHDFAGTAAVIAQLDLVLTIDTATAHLAGALGVPTLLLARKGLALFWPQGRNDTPWYPSVRTLAQDEVRDWAAVIARARAILERRAAGVPWPRCCDPA